MLVNTKLPFSRQYIWLISLLSLFISCQPSQNKKEKALYETYCASCHLAPVIQDLPREIWAEKVLPEMGARLGIRDNGYSPYEGLSMTEQYQVINSGIYPQSPAIAPEDWALLRDYIISNAPDTLPGINRPEPSRKLSQFVPRPLELDSIPGSLTTFMEFNETGQLVTGQLTGNLSIYDFQSGKSVSRGNFGSGVTAYSAKDSIEYVTVVGYLNPSEVSSGHVFLNTEHMVSPLPQVFHRPVDMTVHDFNKDGQEEIILSEFGDLKGALSLLTKNPQGRYEKKVLLEMPGSIRTRVADMDEDGMDDLLVLTAQGEEGVTVFYQKEPLVFEPRKILRFSPVYGTSWFDVFDYDGDGDLDIVTVNGDNADKSFVLKPYHGMRIHINDGNSNFTESYFYPFYGATRVVASDFDQDGDVDFALVSTFPDYEERPVQSFVYLENQDSESFRFQPYTFDGSAYGRWFLMDAGDVDKDGDEDLILSSFTYYFTSVPEDLKKQWLENGTDFMILENQLHTPKK